MVEEVVELSRNQMTRCECVWQLRPQVAGRSAAEESLQELTEAGAARRVQASGLRQRASRGHHLDRLDGVVCPW